MKFEQIWTLTKKNIELYFKRGPVIIFGFLFPFFMSLTWILSSSIEPVQFFSGILGMSIFFTSSAISPVIFPWETREKNLEWILSSPITIVDLILSIILSSSLFGIIFSMILCIVLMVVLMIPISVFFWFILGSILLSWISSCIGVLISAYPTDMTANIMTMSTLIRFPLIFISGIFIALEYLPQPFLYLALISPITYFVDFLKSTNGMGSIGIGIDLIVLLIWAFVIFLVVYTAHKKTILKRF